MSGRRGTSLGGVLLIVLLVSVLAFALTSLSVGHLNLTSHRSSSQQALNLARSAVAQGIERVVADPTLGTSVNPGTVLTVPHPTDGEAQGRLSFSAAPGLAASTNNLAGTVARLDGEGVSVPASCLRLLGVGSYRGVTRRVEALVYLPNLPFALASRGPIRAQGGLVVAGVPRGVSPTVLAGGDLQQAVPVEILSNDNRDDAVVLGAATNITGNVKAVGGIQIPSAASVRGELMDHVPSAALPSIDLASYDPAAQHVPFTSITELDPEPILSQMLRFQGAQLDVVGNLTLRGGLLFVRGNLHVSGGLLGEGALIVTGNTTIEHGAEFRTENQVALMSGGNLTIHGDGQSVSCLQGLVYTGATFQADRVSLIGTLLAIPPDASHDVRLEDLSLLGTPLRPIQAVASGGPPTYLQCKVNGNNVEVHTSNAPASSPALSSVQIFHAGGALYTYYQGHLQAYPAGPDTAYDAARGIYAELVGQEMPMAGAGSDLRVSLGRVLDSAEAPPPAVVTVDPSRFLKQEERMQVRLWREP